ncbi:MAG TPA: SurA N-terminal domain-containing protein [Blastocatellia bacterium]|nr:SurA N-terminal domain-containing protein [Blastocatellia bacterium]
MMERLRDRRSWIAAARAVAFAGALASSLAGVSAQSGAVKPAPAALVIDQTTARVNGDLILKSEILWNLALLKNVAPSQFWDAKTQDQMLRTLIDQRLILLEAAKLPSIRVSDEEVAKAVSELRDEFNSPDDPQRFERRGQLVGLTGPRLNEIVRARLRITKFVDFRFRTFVVVTEPEMQRYFDTELRTAPEMQGLTEAALKAAFEANRGTIEKILIEEKVNAAIDTFLEEARVRAEIVRLDT